MSYTKSAHEAGLLNHLGKVSRNVVQHHHRENLSEFVLHDVCSNQGFNIRKAAYLVNNPDFSCLKGIAGHYNSELFDQGPVWDNPKDFTSHMQSADFNKHVRSYFDTSLPVSNTMSLKQNDMQQLIDYLEIDDPAYHIWNTKHNNHGVFVFERPENHAVLEDHLLTFLHMLSFAPVF